MEFIVHTTPNLDNLGDLGLYHIEGVNLGSSANPTGRFRSLVVDAQTATSASLLCKSPQARTQLTPAKQNK